jgi:hypothetical protein
LPAADNRWNGRRLCRGLKALNVKVLHSKTLPSPPAVLGKNPILFTPLDIFPIRHHNERFDTENRNDAKLYRAAQ